jgi:ankyrin repeat protein
MTSNDIIKFAIRGDVKGLENLLKNSSLETINEKESGLGLSALAFAVQMVRVECVKLLLEYAADPNTMNRYGKTPLFYVGEEQPVDHDTPEKRKEIARLLLDYKADINVCDDINNQALFYVVFHVRGQVGNLPLAELFLKYGADPNHKNAAGNSPLDFAKKVEDAKLIELLESRNENNYVIG